MKSFSVRTRVTLWNVGFLGVALIILGIGIFSGARASLLSALDKDIATRADVLAKRIPRAIAQHDSPLKVLVHTNSNPKLVTPTGETFSTVQVGRDEYELLLNPPPSNDVTRSPFRPRVLRITGKTSSGEPPYDLVAFKAAAAGRTVFSQAFVKGDNERDLEQIRLQSRPIYVDGKIVRVLQYCEPLDSTYSALNGLTWTLFIVAPFILLVATFGGFFLTGRAIQPVREITDAASEVGAESMDARLEVKGDDEFSRLAKTFNGMLDRLQAAFNRMEQAVEQQRRFTADASHELRTPLTVIKANTSLALKSKRTGEQYQQTLAAVNAAADTMGRLVNDLLLLARSDNDRLELHLEPLCLKPVLKDAIHSVARPGIAPISLEMADEGTQIQGDGHSIFRVLVNLLENAARYTPEDGSISVNVKTAGREVVITVADSGVGIAPEHLPHLTDRFYRVDEARGRGEGGNGLGLAICMSLIQAHHGSMRIDSKIGDGTTVTVRIPKA